MKLLRRGNRTEGVSERCEYYRGASPCSEPSAGELRLATWGHKLPQGMCAEHVKPEAHPPDLHDHLFAW